MRGGWSSIVLGLLLGGGFTAAAQQAPAAAPFGRANIVLVQTPAPTDSVLSQLSHYLTTHGFVLDSVDQVRARLTTRVLAAAPTLPGQMRIRAVHSPEGWKLTGLYLIGGPLTSGATAFAAQYLGLEDAPNKTAFRQVVAAAQAIPRGTLRYSRGSVPFGPFTKLEDALKMTW